MAKVVWTEPAIKHLVEIRDYIAKDGLATANAFIETLMRSVEKLEQFPHAGALARQTSKRTYRTLFYRGYVIAYYVKGDGVYIAGVVHGRRRHKWTSHE